MAKKSPGLSDEQREILKQRGVLKPEEIHGLAARTRGALGADENKASCHSDYADDETAQSIQQEAGVD